MTSDVRGSAVARGAFKRPWRVVVALIAMVGCAAWGGPAWGQAPIPVRPPGLDSVEGLEEVEAEVSGGESALRRFEIVTLTALPFTAIHSFLIVKGVRVASEGNLSADVEGSDWNYVGLGMATLAIGIGLYDYWRMRDKDRNELLLPSPSPPPNLLEPVGRAPRWSVPLASLSLAF